MRDIDLKPPQMFVSHITDNIEKLEKTLGPFKSISSMNRRENRRIEKLVSARN